MALVFLNDNQAKGKIMFEDVTGFNANVYKFRAPKSSNYYQCIELHFEERSGIWDDQYARRNGFFNENDS